MTTASLQRVRDLRNRALLACQAMFVLLLHLWLLTNPEIQAMSLLGSAFIQHGLFMNTVLIIGVSMVRGLGAVMQACQDRYEIADLVTGYHSNKMLASARVPTRISSLKNQHH